MDTNKSAHDVNIAKAEPHPVCKNSEALATIRVLLKQCNDEYLEIEKTNTAIQVNGRGYLSKKELDIAAARCETIWKDNKALEEYLKVLKTMSTLPSVRP